MGIAAINGRAVSRTDEPNLTGQSPAVLGVKPPFKDADTDLFAAFRSVFVEGRIDPNKNLLYDVLKPG